MDPNVCYEEMMSMVASILENNPESMPAVELADHVEYLDGWLKNGGFLPREWAAPHVCRECEEAKADGLIQDVGITEQVVILTTNVTKVVAKGMARALYVCAWADYEEERGRCYSGQDLMDVAPETPKEAIFMGYKLLGYVEHINGMSIEALLSKACEADKEPFMAVDDDYMDNFGHYLAMASLGHGVSWFDSHAQFDIKFPYIDSLEVMSAEEDRTI